MDERELEARMRTGLGERATGTDVTVPVLDRVRDDVAARRRTRRGVGAAAAAVLLVAGGVAVATQQGDGGRPPTAEEPTAGLAPGGQWRTEYWADVAVDVPAEWGFGGAPLEDGTACHPSAMVDAGGARLEGGVTRGYVGRPIAATDVCALVPKAWEPSAPYVWLGSDIAPGTYEYDNGYVQQTVQLGSTTVTVGTADAALRERILGTVRAGDAPCRTSYAGIPSGMHAFIDTGNDPEPYGWVCAYHRADRGPFRLSYAAPVDPRAAARASAAQEAAPRQETDCDYQPFEFVVLLEGDGAGWARRTVYETGCAGGTVHLGAGVATRLVAEGVEPWARNGIPAVVHGPTGGKGAMLDSFIGPQG